tara:strand:- start:2121 stop:2522 length:402 start_codon:yes stop_codon:yes gene_type:complete
MRKLISPSALALSLTAAFASLAGCAVLAVSAAAILINEEYRDNAVTVIVQEDVDVVWTHALMSLSTMTDALIEQDNQHHAARTIIDDAQVTVFVEQHDSDDTKIYVAAKKYLVYNHELSELVRDRILSDLFQE